MNRFFAGLGCLAQLFIGEFALGQPPQLTSTAINESRGRTTATAPNLLPWSCAALARLTDDGGALLTQWSTGNRSVPIRSEDVRIGDPSLAYLDPEFDTDGTDSWMAFQDGDNQVWICGVDAATGELVPPDGHGWLIGTATPLPAPGGVLGSLNGPEWGLSADGLALYFLQGDANRPLQVARYRLRDRQLQTLTATSTPVAYYCYPRREAQDPVRSVLYGLYSAPSDEPITAAWQYDDQPRRVNPIPLAIGGTSGAHWIPGARAVGTNVSDVRGVVQIAWFDVVTDSTTLLTGGSIAKHDAYFFVPSEAPDRLWFTCILDTDRIGCYQPAQEGWRLVRTIVPPFRVLPISGAANIVLAHPFQHGGKSFVAYSAKPDGGTYGIYVASLDGTVNARVSAYEGDVNHYDAEAVSLGDKLFIYYYTFQPGAIGELHCCRVTIGTEPN